MPFKFLFILYANQKLSCIFVLVKYKKMKTQKKLIIAIDGHSSCGKSTVAKQLAKHLKYIYIDSGAMYRATTLFCFNENLIIGEKVEEDLLKKRMDEFTIDFVFNEQTQRYETWLNGKSVEEEIRSISVSDKVSLVSKIDFVREKMTDLQRKFGKKGGIVMDGRDIGTVVFPNADIKIFMTASAKIRAERRYKELKDKFPDLSFEEILENVEKRDFIDQNRAIAPLKKAKNAFLLDNSHLTQEEQLKKIIEIVERKLS